VNPPHNQKINFDNSEDHEDLPVMWGVKKFFERFFRDQSGQSLMEIIVGLAIGAILIGTASFGIAFMLRSTSTNQNLSGGSQLTQGLINNVQSFADASWQNVYGLSKGSTNQYFLNASGTSYMAVKGQEGMVSNDVMNGLVGRWGFDEATTTTSTITYDVTGNNNNGTLTSGPTRTVSNCKIANCLSFDGSDDYISVSNIGNVVIPAGNAAFSISLWFNASAVGTTTMKSLMNNETYTVSGFRYGIGESDPQKLKFWSTESGGSISLTSLTTIATSTWYNAVLVYTSSSATLYINGAQEAVDSSGTIVSNTNNIYMVRAIGGKQYFSGLVDDVRIYNRALSASEISQLYNTQPFTRYFYVENVCRTNDSSGNISTTTSPCPGGTVDDPLTQKITAFTDWLVGSSTDQVSLARYITRWGNFSIRQTDWSGSSGQEGPISTPNSSYSSSSNITGTSTYGSIQLQNLSQQ
jgi:hypothetical protein